MKRKIIRLGTTTQVFSLPAKWSQKYGVKPGDELEMEEYGNKLIISTQKSISIAGKSIDLTKLSTLLKRIVGAHYIAGYDELKITVGDIAKSRQIQARAKDFIGLSVVNQGKDFVELKEISSANSESFEPIMRRVFLLLLSIGEESEKAINSSETDLEYLNDLESNINNFTDYCFRIINKRGFGENKLMNGTYCVLNNLELIGDAYKRIIQYIGEHRIRLNPGERQAYSDINRLFKDLYELYYDFSYEKATRVACARDDIIKRLSTRQKNARSAKEAVLLERLESLADLMINTLGHVLVIKT